MILHILSRLARVRLTVGYAATLLTVSITLLILGPQVRDQVVSNASTNLHNLA
ncbi:MAG: rhomboid-like protein, partial [Mycobacterium sp.]